MVADLLLQVLSVPANELHGVFSYRPLDHGRQDLLFRTENEELQKMNTKIEKETPKIHEPASDTGNERLERREVLQFDVSLHLPEKLNIMKNKKKTIKMTQRSAQRA